MTKSKKSETLSEVIARHKVNKLEKSIRGSEIYTNAVTLYGERVQQKLIRKKTGQEVDSAQGPAVLRMLYHRLKSNYYSRITGLPVPSNERSNKLWKAVYDKQVQSGVDAETFVQAQFAYFDQVFKTAPAIKHLLTLNAVQRAQEYAKSGNKFVQGKAYTPLDSDRAEVLRATDEQVRSMCEAHEIGRVEFYKRFVLSGYYPLPKDYTDVDPDYTRAKQLWDEESGK
jgi:hypothetical protein